jgi:hypothetical protein
MSPSEVSGLGSPFVWSGPLPLLARSDGAMTVFIYVDTSKCSAELLFQRIFHPMLEPIPTGH